MKWSEKTLDCECGLKVWRTMFGRNLDEKEMTQLVEKGRIGPLDGFISKKGKRYSAPLVLGEDGKVTLEF